LGEEGYERRRENKGKILKKRGKRGKIKGKWK
jgi:hypothetical protein